jgi:hypothetical protein
MNGTVKFEDFQLKKSKRKNGTIEVDYTLNVNSSGAIRHPAIHDIVQSPHPDLEKSIDVFHEHLVNSWGLDTENESVKNEISVTGIDISGKDEMRGCIITGKKTVISGAVAMNSPRIRFSVDAFGFEQEVNQLVDDHVKEIFAALYEGKSAQLQIGFPETKESEGEDN